MPKKAYAVISPLRKGGKRITEGAVQLAPADAQRLKALGAVEDAEEIVPEGALIDAVGEKTAFQLAAGGLPTPEQVAAASEEELLDVDGIGPATLKDIRAALSDDG